MNLLISRAALATPAAKNPQFSDNYLETLFKRPKVISADWIKTVDFLGQFLFILHQSS